MKELIHLSHTTIANCLQPENSHNWGNKMMGIKPEDHDYYHQGTEAHKIIQEHLSGKTIDARLSEPLAGLNFPIVEEKDFDERCKFEFTINFKYKVIGFVDALDPDRRRIGEIKSSSNPWSIGKFQSSMQRKVYAFGFPEFTEMIGITCQRDPELWKGEKPRVYRIPLTERDRSEALEWITKGIGILESGDYTGGLEDGKCTNYRCYFGKNCQFK